MEQKELISIIVKVANAICDKKKKTETETVRRSETAGIIRGQIKSDMGKEPTNAAELLLIMYTNGVPFTSSVIEYIKSHADTNELEIIKLHGITL